jgi:hypothetical protein
MSHQEYREKKASKKRSRLSHHDRTIFGKVVSDESQKMKLPAAAGSELDEDDEQ